MFLCLEFLILSRLFIAVLWSPAEKGLTFWLQLVMFIVFLLLFCLPVRFCFAPVFILMYCRVLIFIYFISFLYLVICFLEMMHWYM